MVPSIPMTVYTTNLVVRFIPRSRKLILKSSSGGGEVPRWSVPDADDDAALPAALVLACLSNVGQDDERRRAVMIGLIGDRRLKCLVVCERVLGLVSVRVSGNAATLEAAILANMTVKG
ncbi:hypothetical protein NPX13_g6576 [Xylaria arbuscula]|uniref:Uncharacterized protein n=1 Tax=Xylaria arbuscula TaxID=114810 RepID=A0A9W8TK02_9PEZI|nr:hypothetical protein NPX13_g6576 [Xylaria arbuscula]